MGMKKEDPGELQAYVKLMTEHQGNLRAFIVSLLPGSPDVGDVLQESNAALWEKRAHFEPSTNFLACGPSRSRATWSSGSLGILFPEIFSQAIQTRRRPSCGRSPFPDWNRRQGRAAKFAPFLTQLMSV
jgi:hypothetical protein